MLSLSIFAQGREHSWQGHILAQQWDPTEASAGLQLGEMHGVDTAALFWYGESNAPYLTEIA